MSSLVGISKEIYLITVGLTEANVATILAVMGAGLWSAFPLSEPSTQTTIGLLFGMVPAGLKPSTRLLGLIRHFRVVSWSMGKAGGGLHDGLCGHRVKGMLMTYI